MLVLSCVNKEPAPPPSAGVPVTVAKVARKTMPVELASVGNVEAMSTVAIRSQVSGQLLEIHFKEGDFVHKGQLLLSIDSRPYEAAVEQAKAAIVKDEAQLQQAEANLARDSAQEAYSRAEEQRFATLMEKGLIARDASEQARSQAASAVELLRADRAAIESAKASLVVDRSVLDAANVQLSYCKIYSPVDGRTGAVMLKPGNILKAEDAPIVIINQVDPIYVHLTVPQQYWPELRTRVAEGGVRVWATLPAEPGREEGRITFVDNAIDPSTGNIHLRATFENPQHRLWPGLFVNAILKLSEQPDAMVVPMQAVSRGQNGPFVYVVNGDNTVEARPVEANRTIDGLTVVDRGLSPDETVVTDGQTRLGPGAKVQIKGDAQEAGMSGGAAPDSAPGQRGRS